MQMTDMAIFTRDHSVGRQPPLWEIARVRGHSVVRLGERRLAAGAWAAAAVVSTGLWASIVMVAEAVTRTA